MEITCSTLLLNDGNLPLPFFVVITQLFSWIIFFHDCIHILTALRVWYFYLIIYIIQEIGDNEKFYRFSQHIDKLLLPKWKQGNYPVIHIYSIQSTSPPSSWAGIRVSPHLHHHQSRIQNTGESKIPLLTTPVQETDIEWLFVDAHWCFVGGATPF